MIAINLSNIILSFIKENSDNFELIYDSENKDVKIFHHLKSNKIKNMARSIIFDKLLENY